METFWIIVIGFIVAIIYAVYKASEASKQRASVKESKTLENTLANEGFTIEKRLECCCDFGSSIIDLLIDTKSKRLAVCNYDVLACDLLNFQDILECELIENGNTLAKGGVGRAIVGGVIAGGVGAVVGAATQKTRTEIRELYIRLTMKDILNPQYIITFMCNNEMKKSDSPDYKQAYARAEEVYSTITSIIASNEQV